MGLLQPQYASSLFAHSSSILVPGGLEGKMFPVQTVIDCQASVLELAAEQYRGSLRLPCRDTVELLAQQVSTAHLWTTPPEQRQGCGLLKPHGCQEEGAVPLWYQICKNACGMSILEGSKEWCLERGAGLPEKPSTLATSLPHQAESTGHHGPSQSTTQAAVHRLCVG